MASKPSQPEKRLVAVTIEVEVEAEPDVFADRFGLLYQVGRLILEVGHHGRTLTGRTVHSNEGRKVYPVTLGTPSLDEVRVVSGEDEDALLEFYDKAKS